MHTVVCTCNKPVGFKLFKVSSSKFEQSIQNFLSFEKCDRSSQTWVIVWDFLQKQWPAEKTGMQTKNDAKGSHNTNPLGWEQNKTGWHCRGFELEKSRQFFFLLQLFCYFESNCSTKWQSWKWDLLSLSKCNRTHLIPSAAPKCCPKIDTVQEALWTKVRAAVEYSNHSSRLNDTRNIGSYDSNNWSCGNIHQVESSMEY